MVKGATVLAKGFELADAYSLGKYLEYELIKTKNLRLVNRLKPGIKKAIKRTKTLINERKDLSQNHYNIAKLLLLIGEPYQSFSAYAKAIDLSTSSTEVELAYKSIRKMKVIKDLLEGYNCIDNLFLLKLATRYKKADAKEKIKKRRTNKQKSFRYKTIILAGASKDSGKKKMNSYGKLILKAFYGFNGIVISGGTKTGISKIAGDLKEKYSKNIYTIGYVPERTSVPFDKDLKRYDEIRKTNGRHFSPLEPTKYWIDIISSGIKPKEIKVLVINGGKISVAECKLALTLGAKVGIIKGSGGETSKLFLDPEWKTSNNLIQLPKDAAVIKSFIYSSY